MCPHARSVLSEFDGTSNIFTPSQFYVHEALHLLSVGGGTKHTTQYRGAFSPPQGIMKCCRGTGRKSVYTTWHFFLCMLATHCANSRAFGMVADRKALWHASGSRMMASSHTTPLSLSCRATRSSGAQTHEQAGNWAPAATDGAHSPLRELTISFEAQAQ